MLSLLPLSMRFTLFPYATLFRSRLCGLSAVGGAAGAVLLLHTPARLFEVVVPGLIAGASLLLLVGPRVRRDAPAISPDRKSTRPNSSHVAISYAVFFLKKKHDQ